MLTKNEIIDYFKLVNSHAKKELGQNFLISEEVGRNIVNCLDIQENDAVLEIGPGLGALTGFILEKDYKAYKVVEYDAKFVEFLSKSFDNKNIEIIKNNILKEKELNFNKVCGNLPYYITSEIILKIALEDKTIEKGVFMVQKECYKRIIAKEGKDYNALNVLLDYLFDIKQEVLVDRSKFFPIPNVDSLVFSLTKKQEKNIDFAGFLYKIAKICFQNRRKTIFNNLISFIKNKDQVNCILASSNLSSTMRAEELKTADFVRLAEKIKETTIE